MMQRPLAEFLQSLGALSWAVLLPQDVCEQRLRDAYRTWLAAGNGGALSYIDQKLDWLCSPFGMRPWAKSVLVLAFAPRPLEDSPLLRLPPPRPGHPTGTIAGYALNEDYHLTGQRILKELAARLGLGQFQACVDSSPVPEKALAILGELGTQGPNSMLHVQGWGCRIHLGALFADTALPELAGPAHAPTHPCALCGRCIALCPTRALSPSGTLCVHDCRSYLAGQLRAPLTWAQQLALNGTLFGCSACSTACPDDTLPQNDLKVDALELLQMPTAPLRRILAGTPLEHSGTTILKRNAAAAVGTQTPLPQRPALQHLLLETCASPMVADTIRNWQL